ncbi:hypothetical protein [Flavobacterium sp. GT3R68]|uniref:hypothetical protein n=1 Tax=Flavobacterium sp. GT3R68 TaxID=2594437 RepID=UPI000F860750|nr:hypothetical protein [Flavobacterium sp. GT3R68]RTY92345.1 hypothetical protein EKL32_17210 [Flavobacterium sp. GSN2]
MTKQKTLHIISFDNPFPPVYGGVIDVFYKVKALHELGVEIYLHCFVSNIPKQFPELEAITTKVYFYKTLVNPFLIFDKKPLSVATRNNEQLLANLKKSAAPILFEGLKTSYLVNADQLENHTKVLRLHNIEHNYFGGISNSEKSLFRKFIFGLEGRKYRKYEKVMRKFDTIITLSHFENDYVMQNFKESFYIPVFHGNETVSELSPFGNYALYHGDLRMSDNKRAVDFLIKVFKKIPDYNLVIASGCGDGYVEKQIRQAPNVSYISIKNQDHLHKLLVDAHMNVMLSFQQSGTKLKLINSLYKSRFCIINANIVDDKDVQNLCHIAETESEFIDLINQLKNQPYLDLENKINVLNRILNDQTNAKSIANIIFQENG